MLHKFENRNLKLITPDPQLYGKGDCASTSSIWSEKTWRCEKVSGSCTHQTW